MDEYEEEIALDKIPKSLLENPYPSILHWAEKRFKKIGEKVFSFLALMPHSIFIPPIPYEDSFFRTGISFLLLTPPGGAKTIIGNAMEKIVLNPVSFEDITSAEIQTELAGKENVTLVTGDAGRIFKDYDLIKVLEGILSDSRVSKRTKREQLDYQIVGNCYLAGTPQDLTSYLGSGFLSRLTPMVLMHDIDQQDEIGKEIINSIGSRIEENITLKDIARYYKFLYQIQKGMQVNNGIGGIAGYNFTEDMKNKIFNLWRNYRHKIGVRSFDNYYRELIGAFKYLCSSAFLNIKNRKIRGDVITPTEEDLRIALFLMHQEMRTKIHILRNEKISRKIKDVQYLEKVKSQFNISKFNLDMIKLLVENRK